MTGAVVMTRTDFADIVLSMPEDQFDKVVEYASSISPKKETYTPVSEERLDKMLAEINEEYSETFRGLAQ